MSKMVSVRLSDELVEWLDGQDGSRSEVIVRALEALRSPVVRADAQSRSAEARSVDPTERMSEEAQELQAKIAEHRASARPGVRIAMMCDHKECVPPYRKFFDSEEQAQRWSCPDHGRAVRQENKPYFGASTV